MSTIIVAADHGGLAQKNLLAAWLADLRHQVLDAGASEYLASDDFPDYAMKAISLWQQNPGAKILAWCRSGVGMSIALNRCRGIYAGFAIDCQQVAAAVKDDHLNALVFASDYQPSTWQKEIIEIFLSTPVSRAEKYQRRLKKIDVLAKLNNDCSACHS